MIRLSKLADYGIVLASCCARTSDKATYTARELAEQTALPLPTVGKILKALCRAGLLISHRGVHGGYSLARDASTISITEVIQALEGPIALTECSGLAQSLCEIENICPVRSNWQIINQTVAKALSKLTLAQMMPSLGPIGRTSHALHSISHDTSITPNVRQGVPLPVAGS